MIRAPIEAGDIVEECSGFQPSSVIFLMACAANFDVEKLKNTSAPEDFSLTIRESIVGSVTS